MENLEKLEPTKFQRKHRELTLKLSGLNPTNLKKQKQISEFFTDFQISKFP
jgi:hypothetical protein